MQETCSLAASSHARGITSPDCVQSHCWGDAGCKLSASLLAIDGAFGAAALRALEWRRVPYIGAWRICLHFLAAQRNVTLLFVCVLLDRLVDLSRSQPW